VKDAGPRLRCFVDSDDDDFYFIEQEVEIDDFGYCHAQAVRKTLDGPVAEEVQITFRMFRPFDRNDLEGTRL
jgi:hypothetical protein